MGKLKYAFERGGEKTLEISWKGRFDSTEVRFKGEVIGVIPKKKELMSGKIFQLPDQTSLKVQLVNSEVRVLRNDAPVPGSSSDPKTILSLTYGIIYFIAGLNIVLGAVSLIFQVEILATLGFGIISIGVGLIFLLLGFFTQRRSLVALIVAVILYGLDCALALYSFAPFILGVVSLVATGFNVNLPAIIRHQAAEGIQANAVFVGLLTFAILLRIYLLLSMLKGVGAINSLKKKALPTVS